MGWSQKWWKYGSGQFVISVLQTATCRKHLWASTVAWNLPDDLCHRSRSPRCRWRRHREAKPPSQGHTVTRCNAWVQARQSAPFLLYIASSYVGKPWCLHMQNTFVTAHCPTTNVCLDISVIFLSKYFIISYFSLKILSAGFLLHFTT